MTTDPQSTSAASANGLRNDSRGVGPQAEAVIEPMGDAESKDRNRGLIRVDTNSPQLAEALGIAFYEGYHGKPLPDKEWAGSVALHHRYGRAGHEAVSLIRSMTPGAELEAVGAAPAGSPEAEDLTPGEEGTMVDAESLLDLLNRMAGSRGTARPEEEVPRTQFAEWGTYNPSEPLEGTRTCDTEAQARGAAAEQPELILCRRVNDLHGCILTTGKWGQVTE